MRYAVRYSRDALLALKRLRPFDRSTILNQIDSDANCQSDIGEQGANQAATRASAYAVPPAYRRLPRLLRRGWANRKDCPHPFEDRDRGGARRLLKMPVMKA